MLRAWFGWCAGIALLACLVPGDASASDSLSLGSARPLESAVMAREQEWADALVRVLGLERTLPPEASFEDVAALLCANEVARTRPAGEGSSELRVAIAPDRPRGPNEPVRLVLHAPATALYQLTVEGAGLQRWVIDGFPVGHLDVSPLGVAQASAVVPLREGPHELSGYLAGQARADRVELSAYRSLCIAPADGWHPERSLRHGAFARTLVRAFDLDRRLPELDEERRELEGESYADVTAGGGITQRRIDTPASAGAWAVAEASPAEFTWHVELDAPRVVTFRARTFGVREQIWTVDGHSRVTVAPDSIEGAFTWNHVVTLPLSAGRHSLRALISRGAGVDAIEVLAHRSDDAAYASVLASLGMGGSAPAAPVRVGRMQAMLDSHAFARMALGFRLRMAGERREQPLVVVEMAPEPNPERPLAPALPAEL